MAGPTPPAAAPNPANSPQAINARFRRAVVNGAVKIVQPLQSLSVSPSSANVQNFIPRNVGLLLGFYVLVTVQMLNASGTSNITEWGPSGLLSNISFTDFNNYQRINCPGWYLSMVNSVKARRPYGSCTTFSSYPIGYGNNYTTIQAPSTLSTSGQTVQMLYYIPVAYSDYDLRGAIYAAVTGGQMNLQLTVNPTPWLASNPVPGTIYSGGTGGAYTGNVTLDVYQVFYDQLPTVQQGNPPVSKVVVPPLDLATTYELKQTVATALVANQENTIAFSNYREFLSTTAIYANGTSFNAGTDIAYWALQAANLLYIFKKEPFLVAQDARDQLGCDMPTATYYFGTREKPINTQVYGNINLVINPTTVNSNATVYVGYETFAQQNTVLGAQAFATAG